MRERAARGVPEPSRDPGRADDDARLSEGGARTVAVHGAGIAGLTVAHELARLGHRVSVYELRGEAGGFFRSARCPSDDGMPSEYSWHGAGPWYHNFFDLLKQIPFDRTRSLYEAALSRPIDFGIFPDDAPAQFYDAGLKSIPAMFRMSRLDFLRGSFLMLEAWTSRRRSLEVYSRRSAAAEWAAVLSERAARTWRSCFGPWIGSDWTRVSLHTAGRFFLHQLTTRPPHRHPADDEGPAWTHGAGDGWLLFRGPSSEYWFDRWTRDLVERGVRFHWEQALERFEHHGNRVTAAVLASGERVEADVHVLAINPYAAAAVVARTPELARDPELSRFGPLTQDRPHVQVSFRIAFAERVRFPRARTAVVVADSEFNLTLFAEEQAWRDGVSLGRGVESLWTGTSCAASVPGRVHGLPVARCTREQFLDEVRAQILDCGALDEMVREANAGRGLRDFPILRMEVWHEWRFDPDEGIGGGQPKWVTSTQTQQHQPGQATSIENLFVAGAHTRTTADVWSIEAAIESGRLAAAGIDPRVRVLSQHVPAWLRVLGRCDDLLHAVGAPQLLVVLPLAAAVALALAAAALMLAP